MPGTTGRKKTFWVVAAGAVAAAIAFVGFWGRGGAPADESLDERYLRLTRECGEKYPDAPWVTVEEFLADPDRRNTVVVDNRAARERAVSFIPGSITKRDFEQAPDRYRDLPVLVYCTVGCRSGKYATSLRARGFDARNLGGGVLGWAFAEQEFVTPDGDGTRRVHVYARRWNALPPGYEAVW